MGAGGAGLWAALELAQAGVRTAVLTKLYPTRSHTGAAQGGVCAALGNHEEDHWEWHMFDTVKGGDYLVDQDAAEVLAREAIETVIELEHMGLPFNRTPDGKIDQRRFGGHTRNYGEGPVRRSCFAADRTGHMILQTLYQQCIKHGVQFFDEYHVVDLLFEGGDAGEGGRAAGRRRLPDRRRRAARLPGQGRPARDRRLRPDVPDHLQRLVADRRRRGPGLPPRHARSRTWSSSSSTRPGSWASASSCPRRPAARAATCCNDSGERFMERYAPTLMELAPRDMVSRAIYQEIRAGRGIGGKDYVYLDVRHLGRKVIEEKLPDITDFARIYQGVEPIKRAGPDPADGPLRDGRHPDRPSTPGSSATTSGTVVPGLLRGRRVRLCQRPRRQPAGHQLAGRPARLRSAGRPPDGPRRRAAWSCPTWPPMRSSRSGPSCERSRDRPTGENAARIRTDLADVMMDNVGVYRTEELLRGGPAQGAGAQGALQPGPIVDDKGAVFNTDLLEAREVGYLLDCAEATVVSAPGPQGEPRRPLPRGLPRARRRELPQAHPRLPGARAGRRLAYKPVSITRFEPKPRTY